MIADNTASCFCRSENNILSIIISFTFFFLSYEASDTYQSSVIINTIFTSITVLLDNVSALKNNPTVHISTSDWVLYPGIDVTSFSTLGMSACSLTTFTRMTWSFFQFHQAYGSVLFNSQGCNRDCVKTETTFSGYFIIIFFFSLLSTHFHEVSLIRLPMQSNYLISSFEPSCNTHLLPGTLVFRMDMEIKDIPCIQVCGEVRQVNRQ